MDSAMAQACPSSDPARAARGLNPVFGSILFPPGLGGVAAWNVEQPACFHDLNLDQVMASIASEYRDDELRPFFHTPCRDPRVIRYRHEIFADLEDDAISDLLSVFAESMRRAMRDLEYAKTLTYRSYQQIVVLDAINDYCRALHRLDDGLVAARPRSEGLRAFGAYIRAYLESAETHRLATEAEAIRTQLDGIRYATFIKRNRIIVRKYREESDYSARILGIFERFEHGAALRRPTRAADAWVNHIDAEILDLVARLFPKIFSRLGHYIVTNSGFFNPTVALFTRQLRFYQAYLRYIAPIRALGLAFCYPAVSISSKEFHCEQGFDLALAHQLAADKRRVVANDIRLTGTERILIVSGPNQGGKTTFARMFGQLHYLARLGCPLPGQAARIFLCDRVFTHFERREEPANLRSKLEDDMLRIRDIYAVATPASVIVLNEIFNSTPWRDQIFLSREMLEATMRLDALALCVTFIEELAAPTANTVSMVAAVDPLDAAQRTFKVERRTAEGLAYAMSLAEKHGVSFARLARRLDERLAP